MKKIYNYILPVLLTVFAVSCDGDDEEVIRMQNQDPVVTVTAISDAVGYVGNQFTIYGANFGIIASDVEVYVGNVKLQLISCEDEELTVKVPEGTTAGRISVVVYGQRVDTQLMYDVLGVPGITSVAPLYGFVDDVIKFNGHDLGVPSAHYSVLFNGKEESAAFTSEPEMESFSVKVPEGAKSGEIALTITDMPVNVPGQFTVLQHATVVKVQNAAGEDWNQGLAGSAVVITGTNLKPQLLEENIELPGEWKAEFVKGTEVVATANIDVDQSTNEKVVFTVPEAVAAGDYKLTVSTPFEKINTQLDYTVLPMPVVTGISKSEGYVNAEVIIQGTNFGNKVGDIEVKFGEIVCKTPTLDANGNIVVRVPAGVQVGENTLSLTIQGIEIPMGEYDKFEVWSTPEIKSIKALHTYPYGTLVEVGEEITLTGHDFGTTADDVTVTFEGVQTPAEITNITSTEITVKVPDGFSAGKVTAVFENIDEPVVSEKELALLPEDGDITKYVLKNYSSPFTASARQDNDWSEPADWIVNAAAKSNLTYGGLQKGVSLAMQMGWGSHDKREVVDGHIYQSASSPLPVGKYKLVVSFNEVNLAGSCKAYLVVCKGSSFVSIDDVSTSSVVIKSEKIESAGDKELSFEISESGDVSIGVVASIQTNQRFVKFNNVKLLITE